MKNKRLAFLLSFILMCSTAFGATLMPIREVAADQGATIEYTKENGVGYVEYIYKDTMLTLNLQTGEVVNSLGSKINIAIKLENGITYVSSEEFKEVVQKEQGNKEIIKSILDTIYDVLHSTISAITNISSDMVYSVSDFLSDSSLSNSTTTTRAAYTTNIYVRTTSSAINTTHSALFCILGVRINNPGTQNYVYKVHVDGIQVDRKLLGGNIVKPSIMYRGLFVPDVELTLDSIITVETPFEIYRFTLDELPYQQYEDEKFSRTAERMFNNRIENKV